MEYICEQTKKGKSFSPIQKTFSYNCKFYSIIQMVLCSIKVENKLTLNVSHQHYITI